MSSCFRGTPSDVAEVVKICNAAGVPFLPRGAGTSLAGGCLPVGGGVMIVLTRMKRILEINLRDRYAVVEPGVVNVWLTNALEGDRLSLCARSVEPGGLHDRRQCGDELRRAAHAQIRRDGESRAGRRGGAGRRARRADRRTGGGSGRARSGRRGRRQRRNAGDRHQGLGAADAESRKGIARCSASSSRSMTPRPRSARSSARESCRRRWK